MSHRTKAETTYTPDCYRVIAVNKNLKSSVKDARLAADTTNIRLIAAAVDTQLPRIVQGLKALGLAGNLGKRSPSRWPFLDSTIAALRLASDDTSVPAVHLLTSCLALHCGNGHSDKSRGRKGGR